MTAAAGVAAVALRAEPRQARLLVASGGAVVSVAPGGSRRRLLDGSDAVYSPDGTFIAFGRDGDIWLANADGTGQRKLTDTPAVIESEPSWLPDGLHLVYTARVGEARQIRVLELPSGTSARLAPSDAEEWSPVVSRDDRLAFVSTRGGSPAIYVAASDGTAPVPFDATPPATPPADIEHLRWSPDGTRLLYTTLAADGTSALVVDDGAKQTTLNAAGTVALHGTWSPTEKRIAFDDGSGALESIASDGTDPRPLGDGVPLDWRIVPGGRPLYPNLVQRPPSGLVVTRSARGRWLLGFTSMVDNRGPGVLWIRGARAKGAHVMQVRQLVRLAGGGLRVLPPSGELHYVVAPPHYHWHFIGFDHYELRRVHDFSIVERDRKSGFCLADHYGVAQGVPHGPARFLGNCAQFHPEARTVDEGSSVGYTDRYPAYFHGQSLDLTGVPAGNYWLVHRANSDFHLRETSYADDAASLLVRITWPEGHGAAPAISTLRTCSRERC